MPLSYAEKFIPRILKDYHNLKGRFFFSDYKEMEYKMKKNSGRILTSFLSNSMSIHLNTRKRNNLFLFYCQEMNTFSQDTDTHKKIHNLLTSACSLYFKSVMDSSMINGSNPSSLFAYATAKTFYEGVSILDPKIWTRQLATTAGTKAISEIVRKCADPL